MTELRLSQRDAMQYSPLTLAFLGDSVYEQLVRERIVLHGNTSVANLHTATTKKVCAVFQSKAYDIILPLLDETEVSVLKRGRNASGCSAPKHANIIDYRRATAVECLFGFLHLTGSRQRLEELINIILSSDNTEVM
ncbi:MAG: ribonuclease III domain-containing protein [Oscillospiraceae bacterium]|nr:ribonuclease III domain-containing protein [Oscillospiraceae bacterium]